MVPVSGADEGQHQPDGGAGWHEVHRVDAWSADGALAVSWAVTARPATARAGFLGAVLRPEKSPVVLAEDDIELPPRRWELRTSGLWAECVCETPLEHWSYGLESFALVVADPAELLGRAVGDRLPLGWELEFEARDDASWEAAGAYRQDGEVHGVVLLGRDEVEVSLDCVRRHWWGLDPPPVFDATAPPGAVALPDDGANWWLAHEAGGLRVSRRPG